MGRGRRKEETRRGVGSEEEGEGRRREGRGGKE